MRRAHLCSEAAFEAGLIGLMVSCRYMLRCYSLDEAMRASEERRFVLDLYCANRKGELKDLWREAVGTAWRRASDFSRRVWCGHREVRRIGRREKQLPSGASRCCVAFVHTHFGCSVCGWKKRGERGAREVSQYSENYFHCVPWFPARTTVVQKVTNRLQYGAQLLTATVTGLRQDTPPAPALRLRSSHS